MHQFQPFLLLLLMLLLSSSLCRALDYKLNDPNQIGVAYSITVDQSGHGNFTKIQEAINSIPSGNTKWIHIKISPGKYWEKVVIPKEKPYIFLEGSGSGSTFILWNDHQRTNESTTFDSYPGNIIAKGITFKNAYNVPPRWNSKPVTQAVAARVRGDKSSFYHCAFVGLQDTLWDDAGRHYFHKCYIEGGIDFIWGSGQSIYEACVISFNIGLYAPEKSYGYITAQGRNSYADTSGFVFKNSTFVGSGTDKAYLGRAYGAYSRVIIAHSTLSDMVKPQGWDAWSRDPKNIVYAESGCSGPGADTSKRVYWEKKLSPTELSQFLDISYIDKDGWTEEQKKLF